ncbi:tetratricopeptide repeat protein [bacterium]|nr:tetratricopeptide repeat protein [bacterium]
MSASLFAFFVTVATLISILLYLLIASANTGTKGKKKLQISKKDIYEQAELLFKQKKYKIVQKLAEKYLETNPSHYKLRAILAKTLFAVDEIYDAIKECILVLTQDEENNEIRLLLARAYKKINQYAKSINEFKRVIAQDESNMTAIRELSDLYIETNQKALAIQTLEQLSELTENNLELAEIRTKLADLNIDLENYPEAFNELNSILEIYPENTNIRKKLIELYMKVKNNERAIQECEDLLEVNDNNSLSLWLLENLINLYYLEHNIEKTMEYAKKLLEHPFSDKLKTKIYMTKILIASGNEAEGLKLLTELSEENKENIEVKRLLIENYEKNNDFASAVELYKEIIDLVSPFDVKGVHTEMSNLFVKWAKYLFEKHEMDECFKVFTLARQYDEENPETYYQLGQVNSFIKNYNDAIMQYKKAISINAMVVKYHVAIADAYGNLGNVIEQKTALLTALNIDKNSTEVLYRLALLYDSQHDRTNEIETLERIIDIDPNHIDAKYQLALIQESQGNKESALNFYKEIALINPDYKNVQENIRMLSDDTEEEASIDSIESIEDEFQEP